MAASTVSVPACPIFSAANEAGTNDVQKVCKGQASLRPGVHANAVQAGRAVG